MSINVRRIAKRLALVTLAVFALYYVGIFVITYDAAAWIQSLQW
jgi:hypothetical protein